MGTENKAVHFTYVKSCVPTEILVCPSQGRCNGLTQAMDNYVMEDVMESWYKGT